MNIKVNQAYIIIIGFIFLLGASLYYWSRPVTRGSSIKVGNDVIKVEVADSLITRQKGLSGRAGLGEQQGMLFIFPFKERYSFWMKDMLFPIDIVWIKDNRIIGIAANVEPEPEKKIWQLSTYQPPESISLVLEVRAGLSEKLGWKEGTPVLFDRNKLK